MDGKEVCYHHGGATRNSGAPKKNSNAFRNGFYSQLYVGPDDEKVKALIGELSGSDHINGVLRTQLEAALANHAKMVVAQRTYYEEREKIKQNNLDLETISSTGADQDGNAYTTLRRMRDFSCELNAAQNQVLKIVNQIHLMKKDLGLDKDTEKVIFDLKFTFDDDDKAIDDLKQ